MLFRIVKNVALLMILAQTAAYASSERPLVYDVANLYEPSRVFYLGKAKLVTEYQGPSLAELDLHIRFGELTSTDAGKCTLWIENPSAGRAPKEVACSYIVRSGDVGCLKDRSGFYCPIDGFGFKIIDEAGKDVLSEMLRKKARIRKPLGAVVSQAVQDVKDTLKFGARIRLENPFPYVMPIYARGSNGLLVTGDWSQSELAMPLPASVNVNTARTGYPPHSAFFKRFMNGETVPLESLR